MDEEAGMPASSVVRVITILLFSNLTGPPLASNIQTLKVLSPILDKVTSIVAASFKATRPESHPVSKLSILNSAPGIAAPPNLAMILALLEGVRAV